jgi:hypothetical protein
MELMSTAVADVAETLAEPVPFETGLKLKQEFAEKCFTNAQELSRMMDQKAGYLLSAVGLLTTALTVVAAKVMDANPPGTAAGLLKVAGNVFFVAYVVAAFLVVYNSTRVFQAKPHSRDRSPHAPGLIFPLVLLDRYRKDERTDEEIYFHKLLEIGPLQMLHDYASEIVNISFIYRDKQKQVNLGAAQFRWLSVLWIVTLLLFLGTLVLR